MLFFNLTIFKYISAMDKKNFAGLIIIFGTMGIDMYSPLPSYLLVPLMLIGIFLLASSLYDMWKNRNN